MSERPTALVTGASGFVGRHVVPECTPRRHASKNSRHSLRYGLASALPFPEVLCHSACLPTGHANHPRWPEVWGS